MDPLPHENESAKLDFLVGNWKNTGETIPGPFGPGGQISGTTEFHWDLGEKWLLYRSKLDLPGMGAYEVFGGLGFNDQTQKYQAFAINTLGLLMIYDGEWEDEATLTFTLTNPESPGSSRVIYRKLPGGMVQMSSERLGEKGAFEVYFETTMHSGRSLVEG